MLVALGFAATMGLAACGGGGGDSVSLATPSAAALAALESSGTAVVTDMSTGALITGSITVSLASPTASVIVDGTDAALASVVTTNGVAGFFLKAGTDPAVTAVTVYASVTATGYLPATTQLTFTSKSSQTGVLRLIRLPVAAGAIAGTDPGVTGVAATGTAAAGATTGVITVTVAPATTFTAIDGTTQPATGTTVSIPTGTTVTTAGGGAAAAGPLILSAVSYSPNSQQALAAFPGGFSGAAITGGGVANTALVVAGWATFTLTDSAGNKLTNFSNPVSVSMDLPAGTTLGGVPVANGTIYPIYTFNVASNTWTFETNGTVGVQNVNNTWPVTFTVTHFSEHGALDQVPRCNATIAVTGTTGTGITFEVEGEGSPSFEAEGQVVSGAFTLTKIPASRSARVKLKQAGGTIASVQIANLCAGSLSVAQSTPPPATAVLTLTTTESCADSSNRRGIPTKVFIAAGAVYSNVTTNATTGVATVNVPVGSVSVLATSARSNIQYPQTVTVGAGGGSASWDFLMPCGNITGTGGVLSQLP